MNNGVGIDRHGTRLLRELSRGMRKGRLKKKKRGGLLPSKNSSGGHERRKNVS
jgi:hypothetical protein